MLVHSTASKYIGEDGDKTESGAAGLFDTDVSSLDGEGSLVDGVEQVVLASAPTEQETTKEKYVRAILDPEDTSTSRLSCPPLNTERYEYLRAPEGENQLVYFFALDLREVVDLLPRLVGSALEAMRFLGPHSSVLSVVEGNSDDGTWEVLSALRPELEALGVTYFLRSSDINPGASDDRIGKLAELRSQALEPLRNNRNDTARSLGLPGAELDFAEDATVVFLNDVAACTEDIRMETRRSPPSKPPPSLCVLTGHPLCSRASTPTSLPGGRYDMCDGLVLPRRPRCPQHLLRCLDQP
jgi:hypothetical protein